jgi:hypothetical protein
MIPYTAPTGIAEKFRNIVVAEFANCFECFTEPDLSAEGQSIITLISLMEDPEAKDRALLKLGFTAGITLGQDAFKLKRLT